MISVVFPTYNEQDNLPILYRCLVEATSPMSDHDFEFIFVDDCSTDETPFVLNRLREEDNRVNLIRLARNAGSYAAISAGLSMCTGDAAVVLAADLQDPPEVIPRLIEEWKKGHKIVWAVRMERKGESIVTLAFSRAYYFLMNHLSDVKQPPTGADVFLIDRIAIEAFKESHEKNTSITMLISSLGFSQGFIEYIKEARYAGGSKWTFAKRIKLFLDSLISFSYIPLRFMSLVGLFVTIVGLLYAMFLVVNALLKNVLEAWSSLMAAVITLGGLQMLMMGILGEYLWRTYDEVRRRPRYIIEKSTIPGDVSKGSK